MFSRKKERSSADRHESAKKMGLLEVPDMDSFMAMHGGDDDDDDDLEAELAALTGESPTKPKQKKTPLPMSHIERLAAESMKDVDDDVDDEDLENDEELLAELQELQTDDTPEPSPSLKPSPKPQSGTNQEMITLIRDRREMYETAIENAKTAGDTSKARRYDRGLKTLKDLEKSAKAGRSVNEDDIPPPVATGKPKPAEQPTPMETQETPQVTVPDNRRVDVQETHRAESKPPASPKRDENYQAKHQMLTQRKGQYKVAALSAKKSGDIATATKYIKIAKQFEMVIEAMEQGRDVDLSNVPPPPPEPGAPPPREPGSLSATAGPSSPPKRSPSPQPPSNESPPEAFAVPSVPKTAMEALQQRLEKYQSAEESAKKEENSSKARRMGRIVKQFQDAIKKEKLGKPVDYDELPCPPGYPPIPGTKEASQTAAGLPVSPPNAAPAAARSPTAIAAPTTQPAPQTSPQRRTSPPKKAMAGLPVHEQQAQLLRERQKQYKMAALQAKKDGNMEEAKRLLGTAKGFDQMITAADSGLPVNLKSLPPPPSAETDFEMVEAGDLSELTGDREKMYKKIEDILKKQIETCNSNSQYFTQLGDIASAKEFDKSSTHCRQDLDTVKNAYAHGDPVPRFHYAQKTFRMVRCNTDLNDNEIEISIIRGINFYLPSGMQSSELNTYVKYELPYPKDDDGQSGKTNTVKQTNNPEYDAKYNLHVIDRKQRSLGRHFKRLVLKLDVYFERGFFKSDKCLGQGSLKLADLENKCEIHEGVKLMEGRKAVGGTLEVKVRVRQPVGSPEVQDIKEKWLVIDGVNRASPMAAASSGQRISPQKATSPSSQRSESKACNII
ncbi:coiled-coil and C2 domain-containing protein 1-like isoform X2 [Ptychodera flava]|uniref:coiled-coil and C2 domain-containing protein 1-like isoform X2 n=1 Tax=Ptychodera flava TaxID=63121 RepID=UPI003969E186